METGLKAKDIMNESFPLLDSSLTLEACMKKLNKRNEVCAIVEKGFLHSIISYDNLLKIFLERKRKNLKLSEIKPVRNFIAVSPETDLSELIRLMAGKKADFAVVKGKSFFGLITKKELIENNQLLFDLLEKKDYT